MILALLTGATIINEDLGDDIDLIQPEQLGECLKSISSEVDTVIQVGEITEEVKELIDEIQKAITETKIPAHYN